MRESESVTLKPVWQALSDGNQTLTVSVKSGQILLVDSDTAPPADSSVGHLISEGQEPWLITPPSVAWARSIMATAQVIVSGDAS